MVNRFSLPYLGFGLGLRAPHYEVILDRRPKEVDWFEIISENFIEAHEGYWEFLTDIRSSYPIIMHGVSLSLDSPGRLNREYLTKLKKLANFLDVPWFSDHLCWTGVQGKNTHDLLPIPYTEETLSFIIKRVKEVQDIIGRPLIIENPSTYFEFMGPSLTEWDFLTELANNADCGLLLDVNNVYVNSFNHGYDARQYIDALPAERIVQIHLAGHRNFGTHIVDTHDTRVTDEVWGLYAYTLQQKGLISTMVEWDGDIPEFDLLLAELGKAKDLASGIAGKVAA